MQRSVDREVTEFLFRLDSAGFCLALGVRDGDYDLAERRIGELGCRKSEDIGDFVDTSAISIEFAYRVIVAKGDFDAATLAS